jgi:hypothetical protein
MSDFPDKVRRASRSYERLLWIYPRVHRHEYGPLMAQLFRDQCRAANHDGSRWVLSALILRTFPDLALSAFREHLTEQTHHMKSMSPQKLSLILFIAGIGPAILSCTFVSGQPGIAVCLAYFSSLALLLRAFVEWKRPETELIKSLISGAAIAVIYGLVMPVWGKVKLPVNPWLALAPMFLNALVPLFKTAMRVARPRS